MIRIEKTLHKQVENNDDVESLLEGKDVRLFILGYLRENVLENEEIKECLEEHPDLSLTFSADVTYQTLKPGKAKLNTNAIIRVKSYDELVFTAKVTMTPIGEEIIKDNLKFVYYNHGRLETIAHELKTAVLSYLSGDYE